MVLRIMNRLLHVSARAEGIEQSSDDLNGVSLVGASGPGDELFLAPFTYIESAMCQHSWLPHSIRVDSAVLRMPAVRHHVARAEGPRRLG